MLVGGSTESLIDSGKRFSVKARRFVFVPVIFRFFLTEVRGVGSIVQAVGCEDRGGSGRHYARGCYILHLPSPQKRKESTVDQRRNIYV